MSDQNAPTGRSGSEATYNGWANYQTWNVKLWLDNEQGSQEYVLERARELVAEYADPDTEKLDEDGKERAVADMADSLEGMHDEAMPTVTGVFADLMGHALGMVDWHEIAESYIEEACDE